MLRKLILPICLCPIFMLGACAHKEISMNENLVDFVAVTLGNAAEQAHGDLAMLAKLRGQGLEPLLPPSDPSLQKHISISWTGEVRGALKEVCLQIGYVYEEVGTPSAQALTVVVRGLNRPAHKIIEDIAWQIQPQAVISIDPINRTLTLAKGSYAEVE